MPLARVAPYLLVACLLATSCGGDSTPGTGGVIRYQVADETPASFTVDAARSGCVIGSLQVSTMRTLIGAGFVADAEGRLRSFTLVFEGDDVGVYDAALTEARFTGILPDGPEGFLYSDDDLGTVTVDRYDAIGGTIEGSFSLTVSSVSAGRAAVPLVGTFAVPRVADDLTVDDVCL